MSDIESLADSENLPALPPVIAGAFTPEIKERVEIFFHSVASIFEAWVGRRKCVYSPHSLRATTATLLLDTGVPIESVQELLDHKHITTTQIYDKRRRV